MATFDQRDSGYWQAKIRRKGYPAQSKTFRTKAEAEAWARSIESEMDRGAYISSTLAEQITLKKLAQQFENEFAPHHYRGKAWRFKLERLVERLGSYSLVALTPQVISKYRDDRLSDPDARYSRNLTHAPRVAPATVKSEIDLLSKLLDVAQKEFGIPLQTGNPARSIRKPRGANSRDRRLKPQEWDALERECKASRNVYLWPAVLFAVETAMRQGEMLGLSHEDIDRDRRLALLLDPTKIKTEEPRAVPLTSAALAVLNKLPSDKGKLFPFGRGTLYKAFESACKRAGIEDYTWHDLRHEALSRLAERGDLSVLELAAVSGHKTLQMLKRYTHLQAENLARKLG